jgi:hypothetical protein
MVPKGLQVFSVEMLLHVPNGKSVSNKTPPQEGSKRSLIKGYLVNCLEHFFLLFFCLQIMFPQLFALFQILFFTP